MDAQSTPEDIFGNNPGREHAENELEELTRRLTEQTRIFDMMLSSIPDFAYIFDRNGRFVYVNRALLDLWGLRLEEAVRKDFFDLHYPDDLATKLQRQIQQVFETGQGLTDETPYTSPTGKDGYYEYIFRPVFAADGTVAMVAGSTRDITRRKQSEEEREQLLQALRLERSRMYYLFTHSPSFVAVLRGPEHIYELANPLYMQLVGDRDVIGKPVREVVPEAEGQGYFEQLDNVYRTGEPYVGKEMHLQLKREGVLDDLFLNFVYQPIFEADNSVSGIFVHGVDVTAQVLARKEAETTNRLKDEFLATLSHEMRTPLTAVLGWTRMLRGGEIPETTASRALEIIERNAEVQQQLIEDVLDVSRIITGKLRLDLCPVVPLKIVEAAVDGVRHAAEAKKITIAVGVDREVNLVSADPNRLQQVIWNLLTNAIKFTPSEGKVEVRLERVGSRVRVTISDNGIGIAPDFLPHVFERFRQADGSTARQYSGLGLGLAVVRHLVEQHGGTVAAHSKGMNQGSTFIVELPLLVDEPRHLKRDESAAAQEAETPLSLKGVRVLIVDDQADARELLSFLLGQHGAEIFMASSSGEALSVFEEVRPDVLVSDIGMPGEDGYWLIDRVRSLGAERGGDVPFVALTAYASEADREHALYAGFGAHLSKPIEPVSLISAVAKLARGSAKRNSA